MMRLGKVSQYDMSNGPFRGSRQTTGNIWVASWAFILPWRLAFFALSRVGCHVEFDS